MHPQKIRYAVSEASTARVTTNLEGIDWEKLPLALSSESCFKSPEKKENKVNNISTESNEKLLPKLRKWNRCIFLRRVVKAI